MFSLHGGINVSLTPPPPEKTSVICQRLVLVYLLVRVWVETDSSVSQEGIESPHSQVVL